jgi:hypothetical protein
MTPMRGRPGTPTTRPTVTSAAGGSSACLEGDDIGPELSIEDVIDVGSLEDHAGQLRRRYVSAEPFPHIVLDDVLRSDAYRAALEEFPAVDTATWTNWVHVNSRKYGNTRADSWPPVLQQVARALTSDRFVKLLDRLTGYDNLIADWSMDGGGLHQSGPGGFLNVHADFTAHHVHHNWRRRVNALLYFNESWDDAWGGCLELWSPDMKRCVERISPRGNRMVVFTTSETSFHGHPDPMRCPAGVARRSMALYYFIDEIRPLHRSTNYQARPGDGVRSAAIYLDKQALRAYDVVKRRFGLPDAAASRLLRTVNALRRRR